MKAIVSIQDMTEDLSCGKGEMTNSEDMAETELMPSPKQNGDKNEPMDIANPEEDGATKEIPTGAPTEKSTEAPTGRGTGIDMSPSPPSTPSPINGSITAGEESEDKSNDGVEEASKTGESEVKASEETAREDQNDMDTETPADSPKVEEGNENDIKAASTEETPQDEEAKGKVDEEDASEPPKNKMEEATETPSETAKDDTLEGDEEASSTGVGNDDFVNAIEEQLEKVEQEEEKVDLGKEQPEQCEVTDDRTESEKVAALVMEAIFGSAMERVAEKAVFDEALSSLNAIAQSNRRLLDEEHLGTTGKRPGSDIGGTVDCKRPKIESGPGAKKEEETGGTKKIKKDIRQLTRRELEDLVAASMVEVLSSRSEIGQLRRKCDRYDDCIDKWKKKAAALQKQCQDLNQVMKKYITDAKARPNGAFVAPIKITRSVGLQVMSDKKRIPVAGPASRTHQQQAQQVNAMAAATAAAATAARSAAVVPNAAVGAAVANLTNNKAAAPMMAKRPLPNSGAAVAAAHRPAPASVVRQRVQLPPSTTLTKTTTSPNQQKKSVIDVVDLSDDDNEQQPLTRTQNRTTGGSIRVVPQSQLQARSGPGGVRQMGYNAQNRVISTQPGAIIMSNGQQLIPVNPPPGARVVHQMVTPRLAHPPPPTFHHPAPLPPKPPMQLTAPGWKALPPRPALKISKLKTGIVLSWNMEVRPFHASVATYQIFAYQEGSAPPTTSLWKKVGDVKALPLPMACTLTQFQRGNKYHFAVRAIDEHKRVGDFCEPQTIALS